MKTNYMLVPLLLWVFALIASACKDHNPTDPPPPSLKGCSVGMAYDAETTTIWEAANPQEAGQLTTIDKAMMLPQRIRKSVALCIKEDSDYSITTEILTPEEPIVYPEGILVKPREPRYSRAVNNNGRLTYYNALGEVIDNSGLSSPANVEALEVFELFKTFKEQPKLSDADFNSGLAALKAAGMDALQFPDGIVAVRTDPFIVAVIDKNAQMQIGQLQFSPFGKLEEMFMMKVRGRAPDIVLERMTRMRFMNGFGGSARLKRTEVTEYRTFNLYF